MISGGGLKGGKIGELEKGVFIVFKLEAYVKKWLLSVEGVCNIEKRKRGWSHVVLGLLRWKMLEIGISCGVGIY